MYSFSQKYDKVSIISKHEQKKEYVYRLYTFY